ncbi:MAG TPA: sigma-70 family RNA polymerase sigma factor [Thermoguttaceae bacterium]|nr:sigma-70 family RNA polymerase sigma factor [Thermoguttaceae bacterium]
MNGNTMDLPETRHPPDRPPIAVEDAEILAEIARGDLRRFDALVDRYKCRLMSYIGHRVPDRHHAEDLTQESFLRLFRAARSGGYSGRASVCTWLFTIADNCATDYLRGSGRRPLTLETDTAAENTDASPSRLDCRPSAILDPAEAAARRESQRRAEALLDGLPDEQRRVVALKVLGGLTLAEVAAVVGCPLGTAKSRLLYGLRKIEALLARFGRRDHEQ